MTELPCRSGPPSLTVRLLRELVDGGTHLASHQGPEEARVLSELVVQGLVVETRPGWLQLAPWTSRWCARGGQ